MKYIQAMLPVVCLLIVGGTIGAARTDDRAEENKGVTLYTHLDGGDNMACTAVNVSDKTLGITFAVLDPDGNPLSCDSPNTCTLGNVIPTTNPTPEFAVLPGTGTGIRNVAPLGTRRAGYCVFAVSGTGKRDDVRVGYENSLTRTIPGTTTPVFITRAGEGH
jgi:hypothetical protein